MTATEYVTQSAQEQYRMPAWARTDAVTPTIGPYNDPTPASPVSIGEVNTARLALEEITGEMQDALQMIADRAGLDRFSNREEAGLALEKIEERAAEALKKVSAWMTAHA